MPVASRHTLPTNTVLVVVRRLRHCNFCPALSPHSIVPGHLQRLCPWRLFARLKSDFGLGLNPSMLPYLKLPGVPIRRFILALSGDGRPICDEGWGSRLSKRRCGGARIPSTRSLYMSVTGAVLPLVTLHAERRCLPLPFSKYDNGRRTVYTCTSFQ